MTIVVWEPNTKAPKCEPPKAMATRFAESPNRIESANRSGRRKSLRSPDLFYCALESPSVAPKSEIRGQRRGRKLLARSEEHTSELQSRGHLVCRLLLEN